MNHPYPCWASMDEARHAHVEGEREDADEYWLAQAAQAVRAALPPKAPADWFACNVPGPGEQWSADEILMDALDQDYTPVRSAYCALVMGQGRAAELHQALIDYWIESRGDAIAAQMRGAA